MAASLERRAAIMAAVREVELERIATQQEGAASTTASAAEEVAAAEAVHSAEAGAVSDATQAALAKAAAGEAAVNLAVQIQDLAQAQKNLAEVEAAEPENAALINRARQELAAETQRVADAERLAAQAKLASAEASERVAAAEKRESEAARTSTLSGKAQELGQLLTTLGLVEPSLLRAGVGLQMFGQASESLGPKIAAAGGGIDGLVAAMGPILVAGAAVTAVLYAVTEAAGFVKEAIAAAIPAQRAETDFAVLLGNTEAARERLEELDATASKFNLPVEQVRAASRELTLFSQGALGGGKSLNMVVEASARTGQSMTSVASMFGRAYEAIQSGQPIQRVTQQLERARLISANTANELANLAKSGKSGTEVWDALVAALSRYDGAAAAYARDAEGETQGIRTAWNQMLEAFGRPILDVLTPFLHNVADAIKSLQPAAQAAGQFFGGLAQAVVQSLGTVVTFINNDWTTAVRQLGLSGQPRRLCVRATATRQPWRSSGRLGRGQTPCAT